MDIRDEVLDELLDGYEKPEDLLGDDGLLKRLNRTSAAVSGSRSWSD